jgi:hypothetical protein
MSFFSIILFLIKYGPAIISLVTELWELIEKLRGNDKDDAKAELEAAVLAYRQNKDRGPLLTLRNRLRRRVHGV